MDIKDIRKIIELMKQNELSEFELQDEGFRIAIKRRNGSDSQVVMSAPAMAPQVMMHPAPAASLAPALETQPGIAPPPAEESGEAIKSPMVGTFYKSPSPESDAFISLGDEVTEDTVVCIVEAMKVMNEIKAETRGTIRKILVENGTPVQFGQPLFIIDPS